MRLLLPVLAALAAAPAGAAAAQPPAPGRSLPWLGMAVDAGVPGGLGLLVQVRPIEALRVNAGPMWSGIGFGARGGVVVAPFRARVIPSLELEAGYGVRADLSFLARRSDVPDALRPVLAHASYRYGAALVGIEMGSPRGTSFFVRAGIARLVVAASRTATTSSRGGTLEIGDATLRATIPCVKLGVQVWF